MPEDILAKALQAQLNNNLEIAKQLYARELRNNKNSPIAHANLGFIFKQEGHLDRALNETLKAHHLDPLNPLYLGNIGGIYLELSAYTLAIQFSLESLRHQPNNPAVLANLGNAYKEIGDINKALVATTKSLGLDPDNPTTLTTAGSIYAILEKYDEALNATSKALQINPSNSKALTLQGIIHQALGDLMQAQRLFQNSLQANPFETEAFLQLSLGKLTEEETKELLIKAERIEASTLKKHERVYLSYAKANLLHKHQKYKQAATNLQEAHRIKLSYAQSEAQSYIQDTIFFSSRNEEAYLNDEPDETVNVFIVGVPRSGSTLLESILCTNSLVHGLGETKAMGQAMTSFMDVSGHKKDTNTSLKKLYSSHIKQPANSKYLIDKQLYNFRFTGVIAANIPQARILHCRRHPLDNILSMLRANLMPGNNYTANPIHAAEVIIEQEKAMRKYKKAWPQNIKTFDYDLFVASPRSILEPIIQWLGLEWSDSYLHPESSNRIINTASVQQARQPITNRSIGGWKNYIELIQPAQKLIINSGLFNDFDLQIS